jgi:N-acetylglucosamine malate deacetylase 1
LKTYNTDDRGNVKGMASQSAVNGFSEWLAYLGRVVEAVDSGKGISLGPSKQPPVPPMVTGNEASGASVLYCAPHPDDEALSGALALRLRLESSARVTDVAVTLGSGTAQHERRRREVASACRVLGFDLVIPSLTGVDSRFRGKDGAAITGSSASSGQAAGSEPASGLGPVNLAARQVDSKGWALRVQRLAEIFDQEQPDAVFAPHGDDFNTTHIGTYHLVTEALELHLSHRDASVIFVETEFWHEMAEPNLMVAVAPEHAAIQLVAAAEHGGEMMRNPYHLLHPCRLMNNVRRGSEVVGGQGAAVQPFTFAELYCVSIRSGREVIKPLPGGHMLPPSEKASLDWLRQHFSTMEAKQR